MPRKPSVPNFYLVDSHCHLDLTPFRPDLDEVLGRAAEAGVRQIITVGIDLPSSRNALALAERYDKVFATVGVHPHAVAAITEADYEEIRRLACQPKVVAYRRDRPRFF